MPRLGIVNGHPTMLPKGRGRIPGAWAVAERRDRDRDDVSSSWTRPFDTGNVLAQKPIPFEAEDTEETLIPKVRRRWPSGAPAPGVRELAARRPRRRPGRRRSTRACSRPSTRSSTRRSRQPRCTGRCARGASCRSGIRIGAGARADGDSAVRSSARASPRSTARSGSTAPTARSGSSRPKACDGAAARVVPLASALVDATHDVLVVGAGCAGMRAAIEAHDAGADVAVISKLHPTRSHSGAAEGGINAALGNAADDSPESHTFDTVKGSDYIGDQDAIEIFMSGGAGRHLPARALGRVLLAPRGRQARAASVRRCRLAAHRLRGRHHRPRADPGALRAAREAQYHGVRGVFRLEARRERRPLPGRHLLGSPERRPAHGRRKDRRSWRRAARGGSTARRRTRTRAPATARRWRTTSVSRSRTWSSCSSIRRRSTRRGSC